MDEANEANVMKQLKKYAGFFEVHHKTSFLGYRRKANGEEQEVSVDVFDRGSEAGNSRYSCSVTPEDGEMVTGNSASSIEEAISVVHWWELDK